MADEQSNYEDKPTSIDDKIKEQEQKLELLKRLKDLEKKEEPSKQEETLVKNKPPLSFAEKSNLLDGLQSMFTEE